MAARSEAEVNSLLVYKSPAWKGGVLYSFYHLLITVDGAVALARKPTKLKPSEGLRKQPAEDILPDRLETEISEMKQILVELEQYRLSAIDTLYPNSEA